MHILESLGQILTHAVLASLIGINGEEAYMLYIGSNLAVAPYAEVSLGKGALGLDDSGILLPVLAIYVDACIAYLLVVVHRGIVNQVDPQFCFASIGDTCPYRETIFLASLYADAEETVILNHSVLVAMARRSQTNVVRVALEWTIVHQNHLARDIPSGECVGKLERAVLDELGIKATVGGIVDVLEKDSVHRRLYGRPKFLSVHVENVSLSSSGEAGSQK